MNCRELESNFENSAASELPRLSDEAERHLLTCVFCRSFVDTQKEIYAGLRVLREEAPKVPASLDVAVLTRYREQTAVPTLGRTGSRWRIAALWPVAAAAVALVIAATLFVSRPHKAIDAHVQSVPIKQVAPVDQSQRQEIADMPRKEKHAPIATTKTHRIPAEQRSSAPELTVLPASSQEFRSLMYCDELSCDGGMDVVRIELPALLPEPPGASRTLRTISADVLVGADGFARGIRIVH
jgi:hypothetical protein